MSELLLVAGAGAAWVIGRASRAVKRRSDVIGRGWTALALIGLYAAVASLL